MLSLWISSIVSVIGLVLAGFLFYRIKKQKVTSPEAAAVAKLIADGASIFIKKEYSSLAVFVALIFLLFAFVPIFSWQLAISFLVGSIFSALAGFVGMKSATIANVRTAENCQREGLSAFRTSFSSGLIAGLSVSSLSLLGISILYFAFRDAYIIYGFAFGASLVALFARVGGGIFTKSADIGADLTGKVELGMAEDSPDNPAVIADSVGDNVGDVAGMSSDLFESYSSSIIATMVLGSLFLPVFGSQGILLPLLLASLGLVCSMIGALFSRWLGLKPSAILNRSIWLSSLLIIIASFLAVKFSAVGLEVFWSVLSGLIVGLIVGLATNFYTSAKYRPTKQLAQSSLAGFSTNIISGLSLGMISPLVPAVFIAVAIYLSYYWSGFYGVAISSVGMLTSLAISLAADAFGPVVDNAASIASLSDLGEDARLRADELDAVGNTTAAVGKGFAIGSAALTAIVLLFSFVYLSGVKSINLLEPKVMAGLLTGGVMAFVFASLVIRAVSRSAFRVVSAVREQFKDNEFSSDKKPDYNQIISLATSSALRQMIAPAILAVIAPVAIGWFFGVLCLAGFLAGAAVVGFLLALIMVNAGGAWDNAKKFIEAGNFGGVGSEAHKASVVGDVVGDALKDSAGPALNILIKLMAIISIIIISLI